MRFALPSLIPVVLVAQLGPSAAAAAVVGVTSGDGVGLYLDAATGALTGLYAGTTSLRDPNTFGGLYVRDRQHMLDVPPGAPNYLPNPSFEMDSDTDGVPDFWEFDDGGTPATVTLEPDPYDGARAAVIHDFSGASLRAVVPVGPGQRYVIQARVKGPAQSGIRIYYYDASDGFLYSESGDTVGASNQWKPAFLITQAPARSSWAEVRFYSYSNANLTLDMVRMYEAPPAAFAPIVGTVVAAGADAILTGSLPALGLDVSARFIAAATHVGIDVELLNTRGGDRALEAGFIAPVQATNWYDYLGKTDVVTQLTSAQVFDNSRCGGRNVDGRCPTERSIYPFGAVSVGGDLGFAIGYDIARGPQDVEFYYSTFTGESLVSRFRVGAAPESIRDPNIARFNLVLFQLDSSEDGMRSALARYYEVSAGTFENRLPRLGGWLMYYEATDIVDVADFGIAVKTRESEVAADDAAAILSYTDIQDFDHRVPMGDYPTQPTPAEAEARILFNATDPGADPAQIDPARQILVSGGEDASGVTLFDIETSGGVPGSTWSADCLFNLDPDITDRSGNGWPSRFDYWQVLTDQHFVDATTIGAQLDGVYLHDPISSLEGMWNSRRDHLETADYPLSFDPVSFAPALPTAFSAWELAKEYADQLHGIGLTTMARDLGRENFWLSAPIDGFGEYASDTSIGNLTDLAFYRSLAGRRPFMLQIDAPFTTYNLRHAMNIALAHGMPLTPDRDGSVFYWDVPAYLARDRPMFRRYSLLWQLQGEAGWQPVRRATLGVPELVAERFGDAARGLLLFTAWSYATTDIGSPLTIDLAALGVAPGSVRRVVDLVHGQVIPTTLAGSSLTLVDTIAPDDVRLYRVHAGPPPTAVILYAVKRGADVQLSWSDGARSLYEVLQSPAPNLSLPSLEIELSLGHADLGAVAASDSRYYAVE